MRILFDVNVILDVLLEREPWLSEAQQLWDMVVDSTIEGYLAPTTLTTIYYLARKLPAGAEGAMRSIAACLATFEVCSMDRQTLVLAASQPGGDFEDNVQIACADQSGLDGIVTRNAKHFALAARKVYTPTELLTDVRSSR